MQRHLSSIVGSPTQHLRQFDRAIQDYDEALRLKPDFAEAYYYRGEAWREKADPTARSRTTIRRCG